MLKETGKKLQRNPYLLVTNDEEGNLTFELTEDEQIAVQENFQMFKGYHIHKSIYEVLQNALIATALDDYAQSQAEYAKSAPILKEKMDFLEKAVAAILKAYLSYQLPIYIYDLACFLEMLGWEGEAMDMFSMFLHEQDQYEETQIDETSLKLKSILDIPGKYREMIDEAMHDAREKTGK